MDEVVRHPDPTAFISSFSLIIEPLLFHSFVRSSYDRDDTVVMWFWEHLHECSHEERKVIWAWTTGMREMPSETTRM